MAAEATGQPKGRQLHRAWWKEGSVYQIYPASFKDSTGSGTGDLKGIISKVDYLKSLGVDFVWLSPIFESPQIDMGYDISNYRKIDPQYGSIEDVDTLRDELHSRGMKLVLDLVMNHTSDKHEWFQKSRSSKDSEYRDWYIWRQPKYDAQGNRQPPNNWQSHFQGNAWEYDEATGEYYLHLYCKEQPDLNWDNPAVRRAVHENVRFWLDRGADGFRMDVINFISKDQSFPDSDNSVRYPGSEFYAKGPRLHEYLKELGAILKEYDAFNVGEMPCVADINEVIKSVRSDRGELSMIFHFELVDIDHAPTSKFTPHEWTLREFKTAVAKWQEFMYDNDGWNALYLENHDQPRAVSRFANDDPAFRVQSAKMLALFLGLQSGTPFVYQGQELGMHNVPKEWPMEEYKDVDCLNHWTSVKDSASLEEIATFKKEYQKKSRDNARTPMQWDTSRNAGFTSAETPWMSVNPNFAEINAAAQVADPNSVFHCWRAVLAARKAHKEVLVYGSFSLVDADHDKVFAYQRASAEGQKVLVVCNFSADTVSWDVPQAGGESRPREVLLSTEAKTLDGFAGGPLRLAPYEAVAVLY